jgi:transcriptional regulator with XRE-family HTH domain
MGRPPRTQKTASANTEHVLSTVGARLKNARLALKLTQKELAEMTGLQQSYIFEIEYGNKNITLQTLLRLTDVLQLDIHTLFPAADGVVPATGADEALHALMDKTQVVLSELLAEMQSLKAHANNR